MATNHQGTMDNYLLRRPKNVAAWALKAKQRPLTVSNAPYTAPPKGHVAIQVIDVAINPIDWIMQESDLFGLQYPAIFGCDVAGEIIEVADDVRDLHAGQRVIAHCNGYSARDASHGAFQKCAIVPKNAVAELPYGIATSIGVVLPLGISTAAAGLYQKTFLELPFPSEQPEALGRTVLIWGGSSSVGSCAIQLAVASGAEVITTASSRNFDYCRKLGAAQCFDYHDKNVEDSIIAALKGKTVAGAYHAVGSEDATRACARILDQSQGKAIVVTVRGVPKGLPSSVRAKSISSSTIFSNEVGPYIWRTFLPRALQTGTIVPAPDPKIVGEELRSVQLGLDKQKAGVSAAKIVVSNISQAGYRHRPLQTTPAWH
ncbi:hypothetical protein BAUCODRAFT_30581 [Baudoinia panamericana UAMH 10762]|uniref:Enoyl reductase (ER) domain-containing protein n=1 Tax=Baudoinia panamericana (strain UAMH 10762) TaxID=717646 RepID=M2LZJ8_BAUPA|nr:uncharacterized protein BAUCODRAFT_30581 [Baudoinia panamericana UAMH 10762]EMD00118.1 hypothetical protein BAUCODRAFT_30581 [Baudoinia panamericana UAMH 10762]